jgi:hypothetical protein
MPYDDEKLKLDQEKVQLDRDKALRDEMFWFTTAVSTFNGLLLAQRAVHPIVAVIGSVLVTLYGCRLIVSRAAAYERYYDDLAPGGPPKGFNPKPGRWRRTRGELRREGRFLWFIGRELGGAAFYLLIMIVSFIAVVTKQVATNEPIAPAIVVAPPEAPAASKVGSPDTKDWILLISSLAAVATVTGTVVLGVLNHRQNRLEAKRTTFINVVTSERVKWLGKLRTNVSILCALTNEYLHRYGTDVDAESLQKIERLKLEIRLQLNPNEEPDRRIRSLLQGWPNFQNQGQVQTFEGTQEALLAATQQLLKKEWDKVKDEAITGRLDVEDHSQPPSP